MSEKKPFELLDVFKQFESIANGVQTVVDVIDGKMIRFDSIVSSLDNRHRNPTPVFYPITKVEEILVEKPESGRTYPSQSKESYCFECIERHAMIAKTEMRHAIDRYRTAGRMTSGVTEKVRIALEEINGITADVETTNDASPEVQEGLNEILNGVRWISKEYGISGGLSRGQGSIKDLEDMRSRIVALQSKAYVLVEKCPSCNILGSEIPPPGPALQKAIEEHPEVIEKLGLKEEIR